MQHPHFCHQAKVMAGPPRFPGTAHAVSVVCPVLFDTTSRTDGRSTGLRWAPHMGIAPLRGSLRAAPITFRCGWAGVPLSADKIIARQLAKAALGWMGTARHLIGPSLCSFLHRWSSRILRIAVPFLARPLDVIQSLAMYFSSCTRRTENVPSA